MVSWEVEEADLGAGSRHTLDPVVDVQALLKGATARPLDLDHPGLLVLVVAQE
jgi:hypothetical protein